MVKLSNEKFYQLNMIKSQEIKNKFNNILCLLCNKVIYPTPKTALLCKQCIKNPYSIEDTRNKLAVQKDIRNFKSLYVKSYPEIKNLNTGIFWNTRFKNQSGYKDQDKMTKEKINTVISFIPENARKILDLGIGQGYLEDRLKQLNITKYILYGIDVSSQAIHDAKINFKGQFIKDDVFNINKHCQENYFDAIITLELLEHISPSKTFSFYEKVYSLLKKNGVFICSIPLNEELRFMNNNPSGHVRDYTIPIIETELMLSGFTVEEKKSFFAFKNLYNIKNLLSKILVNLWKPNNVVIRAVKRWKMLPRWD